MALIGRIKKIKRELGFLPPHSYAEQFGREMDLPERDSAKRFYMIASNPRCGSTYLGHALIENRSLGVPLEYLNYSDSFYWKRRFGTSDRLKLFQHFIRHRTSPNGCFGFKAHYPHFEPFIDKLDQLTSGRGLFRIVHIVRRDRLSQAVSLVIARQTRAWISNAPTQKEPRYNYNAIVRAATLERDRNNAWHSYLSSRQAGRTLSVVFEDLLASPERELERIGNALQAEGPVLPPVRTERQGTKTNKDWKARFIAELRAEDAWIVEPAA